MTISARKFPGLPAYTVYVNGTCRGVIRKREEGWSAVAGHDRLGLFPSKQTATTAVATHERNPA